LTEAYRAELAGLGVDAVIVEPGTYPTNLGANRTAPDDLARIAPYGAELQRFMGLLTTASRGGNGIAAPDPQEVADAIARLIEMPAGERPLRTVVAIPGQRDAILRINETTAGVAASQTTAQALGLAHV
jgi:NAD(P)-dependent dehydrogenase (short-subunit alcohol dehydrogenase family)